MGDVGTNDMLPGNVLRTNEMQPWFLSEHLVDAHSLVSTDNGWESQSATRESSCTTSVEHS